MTLSKGIKPEDVKPRRLKMMVSGNAGSGKTFGALGFPNLFFIDTEGGATEPEYTASLQKSGALYMGIEQGSQNAIDVLEAFRDLHVKQHDRLTVCVDSLTKWFNMQVQEATERVGSEYGIDKKEALPWMRKLIRYMDLIDMNVILVCHSKTAYENGQPAGTTFDCWDKLEYELDMWLEVTREGGKHIATVRKSRVAAFPLGHRVDWNFDSLADIYGRADVVKQAKPVDNGELLEGLISKFSIDDKTVKRWTDKAGVKNVKEFDDEQTALCVDWINNNAAA
jgi:hypothetical protein